MKDLEEVKIGQIWIGAQGGSWGYEVVGIDANHHDAIVRAFNQNSIDLDLRRIDLFKITYRYNLVS